MSSRNLRFFLVAVVTVIGAGGILADRSVGAAETTVAALAKETHFHGIAADPSDPTRIYLATHHGLYALAADGSADRISAGGDDFMEFTPPPVPRHALGRRHGRRVSHGADRFGGPALPRDGYFRVGERF